MIKSILKKIAILFITVPLTGCFFFSKQDASISSSKEDLSRLEITRIHSYGLVDFDHVFTNGGIAEFTATYYDQNGEKVEENIDTSVNWRVLDTSIAGVDSGGHVTGKKNGVTKLTGTYRGVTGEITLDVKTIAKTYELEEPAAEYRTDKTYGFPINFAPADASIDFTLSNSDIIRINEQNPNKFDVIGVGSVDVTATAFTYWAGDTTTYHFTIDTLDKNAPTFYLNGKPSTSTTFSCAKNKYDELPLSNIGITAKDCNDIDITSSIDVSSGAFDLSQEGTYNITLSVRDYGLTSYFQLKLVVCEYDEKKTLSPIDAVTYDNLSIVYDKPSPTYRTFNSVSITATVTLNSKYFCSDGVIHVGAHVHAKYWGASTYFDIDFGETYQMSKDGPTEVTLTATWSKKSSIAYEGSELIPSIYLSGYCYEKITY